MSPSSSSKSCWSPLNEPPLTFFFFSDPRPFQTGSSGRSGSLKMSIFSSFAFGFSSFLDFASLSLSILASSSTSILYSFCLFDFSFPNKSSASFYVSESSRSFFFFFLSLPWPNYFLRASFGSSSSSSSSCF